MTKLRNHQQIRASEANTTHGMSKTKVYRAWCSMKRRCYGVNTDCYDRYGGRGIEVCQRWLRSFENFYIDMGSPPTGKHSVDRIDNDGDYTPRNCRWATPTEQSRNRRVPSNSQTGLPGVGWRPTHRMWRARIGADGVLHDMGYFDDWFEAVCARKSAEVRFWGRS